MSEDVAGAFKGTLAELYDRYLVPMNFVPHAQVLARRAHALDPRHILELAAGTGAATGELVRALPGATIVATDLNQPMIDIARTKPGMETVAWRQADAMKLPFADNSFDLIVCQFGVMFFPDKQASFREASRVLRPGGTYLFVLWDSWTTMLAGPLGIAADAVGALLGRDPASLLNPAYHDDDTIRTDLAAANFRGITVERIARPAEAASAREAAVISVHGSLIKTAIEATSPERLDEATDAAERALFAKFGGGAVNGTTIAVYVAAEKPLA